LKSIRNAEDENEIERGKNKYIEKKRKKNGN
jgi:hypothetical protein